MVENGKFKLGQTNISLYKKSTDANRFLFSKQFPLHNAQNEIFTIQGEKIKWNQQYLLD